MPHSAVQDGVAPMDFDPDHLIRSGTADNSNSTGSDRANSLMSDKSWATQDTELAPAVIPLQQKGLSYYSSEFDPVDEEQEGSFDLVSPPSQNAPHPTSIEKRAKQLFSRDHLQVIFSEPALFRRFARFLSTARPKSIPTLIYYLDAVKSLRAIAYANSLTASLEPVEGLEFTQHNPDALIHNHLQEKASKAFDVLVREDLPAYIAQNYINIVSASISQRIAGTLAPHLHEASEGLAEVFCLTDPARKDNPIVLASEEFNRTTQYGMEYVIGRNCRFLQGPGTETAAVRRLSQTLKDGYEHSEVLLNYRRDGSPFLNLLMMAPLTDSRGKLRYFIGAQVDVSGLVKDGTDLDGVNRLIQEEKRREQEEHGSPGHEQESFEQLAELMNFSELSTVSRHGGRIYKENMDESTAVANGNRDHRAGLGLVKSNKPRLLVRESSSDEDDAAEKVRLSSNGRLGGVYTNYLLIRPYPSLRILFASPSLRVPGLLQSPLMDRIGGSARVRDNITTALAEGRGVTAKVRWITRFDSEGRSRYLHFTPLIGSNGQIGVWMVVLVDVDSGKSNGNMPRKVCRVTDDSADREQTKLRPQRSDLYHHVLRSRVEGTRDPRREEASVSLPQEEVAPRRAAPPVPPRSSPAAPNRGTSSKAMKSQESVAGSLNGSDFSVKIV